LCRVGVVSSVMGVVVASVLREGRRIRALRPYGEDVSACPR